MNNKVYFIKTKYDSPDYYENIINIIEKIGFYDKIKSNEKVGIKIHLRDYEDSKYVNKNILLQIQENIKNRNAKSFLMDNDTLYHSKLNRMNINEIKEKNNLNIILNDETIEKPDNSEKTKSIPLLKKVEESDYILVLSHFKGHPMLGFSGALKNTATGLTNQKGQIMLHKQAQPFISKIACLACNACAKECPENCINVDSVAHIDEEKCTGCNVCISTCPKDAIKINKISSRLLMKRLTEFSSEILDKKDNKVLFINTLIKIKPYYDNKIDDTELITEDIGILASYNPVAIDKASYDLINGNENHNIDKFKEIWRTVDGTLLFDFAEQLKIGTQSYELIEV